MAKICLIQAPTEDATIDLVAGRIGPHGDWVYATATRPDWEFEVIHRAPDQASLNLLIQGARVN